MPTVPFTSETSKALTAKRKAGRKATIQTALRTLSNTHIVRNAQITSFVYEYTLTVQALLKRLALRLESSKQPGTADGWSKTLERMFGIWAHLTCTPSPGSWRPQSRASTAEAEKRLARILKSQPMIDVEVAGDEDQAKVDEIISELAKQAATPADIDASEKESLNFTNQPVPAPEGEGEGDEAITD